MIAHPFRRLVSIALLMVTAAIPISGLAQADTGGKVMLVLDASGSMWGRVDEREKILIAREVVGEMLDYWDPSLSLGLVAYGHRTKGECSDIETLVPVGGELERIRDTVNGLQPRGKTPLSAAVQQAAEQLRFTEDKATVILVSDGRETCDLDPCAVGRDLERMGVDFTAHVIGFDISPEDRAGLECLASETGGQYFDAQHSEDLRVALEQAVEQIKSTPDTVMASLGTGGAVLDDTALEWTVIDAEGGETGFVGAQLALPLVPGQYEVVAVLGDLRAEESLEVLAGENRQHVLPLPAARVVFSAEATLAGQTVADPEVQWSVTRASDESGVAGFSGAGGELILPAGDYRVVGDYEGQAAGEEFSVVPGADIPVTLAFTVEPASLEAVGSAPVSSIIAVTWEGPDGDRDYVTVVEPSASDGEYGKYFYTARGNPGELQLPDTPGEYELRYMSGKGQAVMARRPITVEAVATTLEAPESAPMGNEIEIAWQGPDGKGDYITVVTPDTEDGRHGKYTYTREGSPLSLVMPDSAGEYEIRYVSAQSNSVLARRMISVAEVTTDLAAPETAPMGSEIEIAWQGPDGKGDYITVVTPDTDDGRHGKYTYTREGSPLSLVMPDSAGEYEIRYVSAQSNSVLARRMIRVEEVAVSLTLPAEVPVSAQQEIHWTGPDGRNDYITVVTPDTEDRKHGKYTYTRKGNPLVLQMPDQPGLYELRYVSGQSGSVLGRVPVEISAVAVTLDSLGIGAADQPLRVQWQGPGAPQDLLAMAAVTDPDDKWVSKSRATQSPLDLRLPGEPGLYELRYVTGQSNLVLARRLVEVVPAESYLDRIAAMPGGTVKLSARRDDSPVTADINWQVYAVDGRPADIQRSSDPVAEFSLPMGGYRANVSTPAGSATIDFLLDSGVTLEKEVVLP